MRLLALATLCLLTAACASVKPVRPPAPSEPDPVSTAQAIAEPAPQQVARHGPRSKKAAEQATGAAAAVPLPVPAQPSPPDHTYARLALALGDPVCEGDRVMQRWIDLYAGNPERLEAKLLSALPLMDYVLREIQARDLPAEFALLPMIESTFQPLAGRRSGAFGLWQLMPPTARSLGLKVDSEFDARLAPAEATRAALDYLERLQGYFGDWRLAALGFNAGENRIKASLNNGNGQVSPHHHQPPGLAMTSYEYLGKLRALSCLIAQSEHFGIDLPSDDFEPLVAVKAPLELRHLWDLADASGLTAEQLRSWNPALAGLVLPRGHAPVLLMPQSAGDRLQDLSRDPQRLQEIKAAPARGYQVREGDTLWTIARRHGMALADLLAWNSLGKNSVIRPGQWLRFQPR